jgi:hypothetical protein
MIQKQKDDTTSMQHDTMHHTPTGAVPERPLSEGSKVF